MLEPGAVFGDYTIERLLGAGGSGSVYLARHDRFQRSDALKVFAAGTAASPLLRSAFTRECTRAAGLQHPNIVPVLEHGDDGDRLWLATQFVDGTDVGAVIADSPQLLTPDKAVQIATEVAAGLDHAHLNGVLHRDVKPSNILVAADHASIRDFGISRSLADTGRLDAIGDPMSTLAYASPEQLAGRAVDQRADVYGLGCTLHEMLTGSRPFPRDDMLGVINAHLTDAPPKPSESGARLPVAFDAVIARALAKDPAQRYATCGELADDARRALATAPVRATAARTRSWRRPALIVAALAVVAVGVVLAVRSTGDDTPHSSSTPSSTAAAAAVAQPTTPLSHDGYTETSVRIQNSTSNASFDVKLPQIRGRNTEVVGAFDQAMLSALQDQIGGYPNDSFTLSGGASRVAHIGDHVISGVLLTSWNANPPGAHPTPLVATAVIDSDKSRPIALSDLFSDEKAGLQKLSSEAARLLPGTDAGKDFDRSGITPTEENFRNWLATPKGMELHFGDDQVGPHAVGLVVVTVPWDRLADVIDPEMLGVVRS